MNLRLALATSVLLLSIGCAHARSDGSGTDVGMRPLSFVLNRIGGGHDSLAAHPGHIVLLDLWASWCPPCREELPALSALAVSDRRLVVLAANQGEAPDVAGAVAKKLHLRMPILLDRDQAYGAQYATIGLPTAIILKADGNIAAVETGSHSLAEWRQIIAKVTAR